MIRAVWCLFCLVVMIGLFSASPPAWAVSGPVAVAFPGFEPMPMPTYAPFAPRPGFSGGAVVVPGELYVPGRGGVLVPGRFSPRAGASRAIARALFRNPYVVAGLVLGWLGYEGIKKCQESGGAQFWCINRTSQYKDWMFGRIGQNPPVNPAGLYKTPDAAYVAVYPDLPAPSGGTVERGACKMTNGSPAMWNCYFTTTDRFGNKNTTWFNIQGYLIPGANTREEAAVEADFDRVADAHPLINPDMVPGSTLAPDAQSIMNTAGVPVPVSGPAIKTGFVSAVENGRPYPCTAFASGSCLDGWRISPYPTSDCPNCVRLDPVTVDSLNTDAVKPPSAGDGTASDTDTSTSDPATKPDKERDPCEVNPDRLGCARLGEDEGKPVPKVNRSVSFTADYLGLPASCPSDIAGPKGIMISFAPACEGARLMRPLVIAFGAMAAMMIVISAVRS